MKKELNMLPQNLTKSVPGITNTVIFKFKRLTGINYNARIKNIKNVKRIHKKLIVFLKKNSTIMYKDKDIIFLKKLKGFQSEKHIKRYNK